VHERSAGSPDTANPAVSPPVANFSWMCPLPETGVLSLSGEDAGKLLQGQSTCDLLGLRDGEARLAPSATPRGVSSRYSGHSNGMPSITCCCPEIWRKIWRAGCAG